MHLHLLTLAQAASTAADDFGWPRAFALVGLAAVFLLIGIFGTKTL